MSKSHKPQKSRATRFTCDAPSAQAVFLAGTFNGWDPQATPMAKDAAGHWGAAVDLPPGRHEFKFVVDGEWCCERRGEEAGEGGVDRVPNAFGTMNRVIEVV